MPHLPNRRFAPSTAIAAVLVVGLVGACGGDDDVERDRLVDERIARERAEAARDARQEERIRDLERRVRARRARERRASTQPATPPAPTAPPSSPPAAGTSVGDWPGGSAYTAIIASLRSESEARALQQQATSKGLDAGVLLSSDFRSLRPGYWVVFSGSFPSQTDAVRRAARAKELGYGEAYPRLVSP